ncbi:MAG: SDR family NAD(P)-dependent oxidoreductase [Gammaproteobacteria bacterium]|nr:SDR family NAD(P)-dependent oxidoreductase [Gammaproteobacteria bacterium]
MSEVCLVTGVGPGTGRAIVERFSERYQVAMIARNAERLAALAASTPNTTAYPCDVTDFSSLRETITKVTDELGAPSVVVHNAVGGAFGDFLSIDPEVPNNNIAGEVWHLAHQPKSAWTFDVMIRPYAEKW